MTETEK